MLCPHCHRRDGVITLEARTRKGDGSVRRRRACRHCALTWTTAEQRIGEPRPWLPRSAEHRQTPQDHPSCGQCRFWSTACCRCDFGFPEAALTSLFAAECPHFASSPPPPCST